MSVNNEPISDNLFEDGLETQKLLVQVINSDSTDYIEKLGNETFKVKDYVYNLSLRRTDFESEKEYASFIRSTERLVRSSSEYKLWLTYLRESLNYKYCQITGETLDNVTVEVHHHPVTLYLIVKFLIEDKMYKGESFSSLDIALETLELHYNMNIGFVLLVTTLHEKFHNGAFRIPMELVKGNYQYLLTNYLKYANEKELDLINSHLTVNYQNCGYILPVFDSSLIWIKKEEEQLPQLEEIKRSKD